MSIIIINIVIHLLPALWRFEQILLGRCPEDERHLFQLSVGIISHHIFIIIFSALWQSSAFYTIIIYIVIIIIQIIFSEFYKKFSLTFTGFLTSFF